MAKTDELKTQVEMMKAELEENSSSADTSDPSQSCTTTQEDISEDGISGMAVQIKDIIAEFGNDLKESNTAVVLGAFILGLAVGRLFSK